MLWSIKHLRSKLEYTQKGLRTYISVLKFILDWNSHAPGPGEETGLGSLSVPGAGAVCSVRSTRDSRSRSQTVLEIEFITICFPNDILWS